MSEAELQTKINRLAMAYMSLLREKNLHAGHACPLECDNWDCMGQGSDMMWCGKCLVLMEESPLDSQA